MLQLPNCGLACPPLSVSGASLKMLPLELASDHVPRQARLKSEDVLNLRAVNVGLLLELKLTPLKEIWYALPDAAATTALPFRNWYCRSNEVMDADAAPCVSKSMLPV